MSIERYLKDENGLRKYIELMESTATTKRTALMDAARHECPSFVETAEKYLFTFDRITKLPDMELTEVLGATGLKPVVIATAIASVEDLALKEKLLSLTPRKVLPAIAQALKDTPVPKLYDVGGARLQMIKKARELEVEGKLDSMAVPKFSRGHFLKMG